MSAQRIKIFLASSNELESDRKEIEIFVGRENKRLVDNNVYVELNLWEDFLESMAHTSKQDDYNQVLLGCDILICLLFRKIGKFTRQEFDVAYGSFKNGGKPKHIFVYFKEGDVPITSIDREYSAILDFKEELYKMGHFPSKYKDENDLLRQIKMQFEKLLEKEHGISPSFMSRPDGEQVISMHDGMQLLVNKPVLVFDIDGTVLNEGQRLSDEGPNRFVELFKSFASKGFHIVFITGNNYDYQKGRVLEAVIQAKIAESITCFSDGGSRLFEFSKEGFRENTSYSTDTKIDPEDVGMIGSVFKNLLTDFLNDPSNRTLARPELREMERLYDQYGSLRSLKLTLGPINLSSFKNKISNLEKRIISIISELNLATNPKLKIGSNSVEINFEGIYSASDAEKLRPRIEELFSDYDEFFNMAKPEFEKRGGEGFTSQIALKPFKRPELREKFLKIIKEKLDNAAGDRGFSITFGGKTTIDIQRKNVNKRKALNYLITERGANPKNIIYFGDEFVENGNDLPIAIADDNYEPPEIIVHVGDTNNTPGELSKRIGFKLDGNGTDGTANYLSIMENTIKLVKLSEDKR